ncbi:MAG: hypothetical protein IKK63_02020 [Clostridia bacterium]|nr:hypothetical protein [Clostridia bacterium]MBR3819926.1 hypothetical protein [Clostridia bacterium]
MFALIAWLIVATEFAETQNTISNVPVQINYSNVNNNLGGLQPFLDKEYTVDVTISGKRYIVESDEIKDDILVIADTSLVNSVGEFPLTLSVTSKSVRPEYEFVSISPQITDKITFDYFKEEEFKIEPEITFSRDSVRDGYHLGDIIVSDLSSVKVSGPESSVKKVSKVVARAEHDGDLRKSTSVEASLLAVDKNNVVVQGVSFNRNSTKVNVKIPVYSIQTLPVVCSFSNIPSEYIGNIPFEYTISPSFATFGVFDEDTEKESVELATKIDFTKLNVGENKFTFSVNANEFSGAVLLDEDITEFVVTVKVNDVISKNFIASSENIRLENLPNGVSAEFSDFQFSELTVIGPEDNVSQMQNENIILIADFGAYDEIETETLIVPVRVSDGYCWSFGEYYAVFNIA